MAQAPKIYYGIGCYLETNQTIIFQALVKINHQLWYSRSSAAMPCTTISCLHWKAQCSITNFSGTGIVFHKGKSLVTPISTVQQGFIYSCVANFLNSSTFFCSLLICLTNQWFSVSISTTDRMCLWVVLNSTVKNQLYSYLTIFTVC